MTMPKAPRKIIHYCFGGGTNKRWVRLEREDAPQIFYTVVRMHDDGLTLGVGFLELTVPVL